MSHQTLEAQNFESMINLKKFEIHIEFCELTISPSKGGFLQEFIMFKITKLILFCTMITKVIFNIFVST